MAKNWKEMDGWEKVWEVTQIAAGCATFAAFVALALFGGAQRHTIYGRNGSIWFVNTGQTKKPGSWSSGKHKQR